MQISVAAIQFTDAGVVLPQKSAILACVQQDINAAFGGGVNPQLRSALFGRGCCWSVAVQVKLRAHRKAGRNNAIQSQTQTRRGAQAQED